MGFCHRCGEITTGKCGRCGGRSIESTLSSLSINSGEAATTSTLIDKWQSQYENGILAPEDLLKKANVGPKAKRMPVTQSEFYSPPSTIKTETVCTCCSKFLKSSVLEDDLPYCNPCHRKLFGKGECPTCQKTVSQTESFVEHADRFWHRNCFNCFSCLISLKDAPMVDVKGRPCCEKCLFAQEGKKTVAPSFGSVSSDSSTESFYIRPRLPVNKELFTPPSSRTPSPPKQQQKVSQRPCQGCHALLGVGNKKLKVQLSSGSYAWFHKTCFVCCECRLSFNDGDCVTDGELFYHNQCDPKKNKQAPLSLPQCAECCLTIDTDACRFNGVMYHLKCFRCMDCKVSISPTQPVFIEKGLRYCTKCIDKPKQVVPTVVEEKVTHQEPQLPISLIPRQQRTLKLGGSKTCPRCKQSISIMDDTPGPLTTRWHKKCLCCYKCNKQLDSGAKVCPGTKGEAVVYCRTCVIAI